MGDRLEMMEGPKDVTMMHRGDHAHEEVVEEEFIIDGKLRSQLGMMVEPKDITMMHSGDHAHEEVVEEEYIMDGSMIVGDMTMDYVGEEEVHCEEEDDGDEYGGMSHIVYDSIVEFKRTGIYPEMADQRVDRSAHCHWRLRCSRFLLNEDGVTLMYTGIGNGAVDQPKFVIKKGEVKDVVERVHTLVGHLGTKRTQVAIMTKFYWRTVRNDVKTYIVNCAFCLDKKIQGKKLSRAPIDVRGDNFELLVEIDYNSIPGQRLVRIHLDGYSEEYVQAAAMSRMTSYTFRSTANRKVYKSAPIFKRAPYMRRPRYDAAPSPVMHPALMHFSRKPFQRDRSYIDSQRESAIESGRESREEMEREERMESMEERKEKYIEDIEEEEEELTPVDPSVASSRIEREETVGRNGSTQGQGNNGPTLAQSLMRHPQQLQHMQHAQLQQQLREPVMQPPRPKMRQQRQAKVYDSSHPTYRRSQMERGIEKRRPNREGGGIRGAAGRLSGIINSAEPQAGPSSMAAAAAVAAAADAEAAAERHRMMDQGQGLVGHDIEASYEEARDRPEMAILTPLLFMEPKDNEVAKLQKELIYRQLELQKMQMRLLHLEAARYEDVDSRGVEELNVIDEY